MTAFELIDSILKRPQEGMPANERILSPDQLSYLRRLIGQNEEGAALRSDGPFVQVWAPMGRRKFRIVENPRGRGHKLIVLANLVASDEGRLF